MRLNDEAQPQPHVADHTSRSNPSIVEHRDGDGVKSNVVRQPTPSPDGHETPDLREDDLPTVVDSDAQTGHKDATLSVDQSSHLLGNANK